MIFTNPGEHMIPREWFGQARCTREERAATIPLMQNIIEMSLDTRYNGVLYLEYLIKTSDPPFLRDILGVLMDVLDVRHVMSYGVTRIAASGFKGRELLEALVILQGALSIGNLEPPQLVALKLASVLGIDADLLVFDDHSITGESSSLDFNSIDAEKSDSTIIDPEYSLSESTDSDNAGSGDFEWSGFGERPHIASIDGIRSEILNGDELTEEQIQFLATMVESIILQGDSSSETMITDVMALALIYVDMPTRIKMILSLQPLPRTALVMAMYNLPERWTRSSATHEAASILNNLDGAAAKEMLDLMGHIDSSLVERIPADMLTFGDVTTLDQAEILHIIHEWPLDFTSVLKAAPSELADRIFNALPQRVVQTIQKYMDAELPARYHVESSLATILEYVRTRHSAKELIVRRLEKPLT
jgi:hypothetical protein